MRHWALLICAALLSGCGSEPTQNQRPTEPAVQFQRASADLIVHGERLSRVLGCSGCHGEDLTGEDWSEPGFGRLWTANLTRSAQLYSDEQLEAMIRAGKRPDGSELWGMPSHLFTQLTDDDMAAVIAIMRAKPAAGDAHPRPAFEEAGRREIAAGTLNSSPAHVKAEGSAWPPDAGANHQLGRYLVRATCAECHEMNLEGGQPHPEATPRPDLKQIVPAYDAAAFARLLRTGKPIGDRELKLMGDVARSRYQHLTAAEVTAIHGYLQAVSQPVASR